MPKLKKRKYYLLFYGTIAICMIILIPMLIISDVNLFVTIMLIILTVIYISSCYAVFRKGYKNVPPQITFPIVRLGRKSDNDQKISFKKRGKNRR